jgi:hypothetical protein
MRNKLWLAACFLLLCALRAHGQSVGPTSFYGGGGSTFAINGTTITNATFSDTTPSAVTGGVNVLWQSDGTNVSAYVLFGALPAGTAFCSTDTLSPCLTFQAGGVAVTGNITASAFISNATTNTAFYFNAGAGGLVAPVANTIIFSSPTAPAGQIRIWSAAAPAVAAFSQWSAPYQGASTVVQTPTAGGAAFVQADVVASPGPPTVLPTSGQILTVTGCSAKLAIQEVNSGTGSGAITKFWPTVVNPGTSTCSTGAGQAVTGATGHSATANIATVLPVSTESFLSTGLVVNWETFEATFDGGGAALAAATYYFDAITANCTITSTSSRVTTGSAVFTFWNRATGSAGDPTVGDIISNAGITTATGTPHNTNASDFTVGTGVTVTALDKLAVHIVPDGTALVASIKGVCTLR